MSDQDLPAHSRAHSVTQGASIVLLGMSPIVEMSDSTELRLTLSAQHLKSGRQIALREGDPSSSECFVRHASSRGALMLRIERSGIGQVVFTLSGRMQTEDIEQFRQLLVVETSEEPLMFDLRDVTLVNQDAVTFLAHCESNGVKLENCPLHIRNWIDQEKRAHKRRQMRKRDT